MRCWTMDRHFLSGKMAKFVASIGIHGQGSSVGHLLRVVIWRFNPAPAPVGGVAQDHGVLDFIIVQHFNEEAGIKKKYGSSAARDGSRGEIQGG